MGHAWEHYKVDMVIVWIGIAIGVLITTILILKAIRTNPREVIGTNKFCRKCGTETKGLRCPKCERKPQSFGVWFHQGNKVAWWEGNYQSGLDCNHGQGMVKGEKWTK